MNRKFVLHRFPLETFAAKIGNSGLEHLTKVDLYSDTPNLVLCICSLNRFFLKYDNVSSIVLESVEVQFNETWAMPTHSLLREALHCNVKKRKKI